MNTRSAFAAGMALVLSAGISKAGSTGTIITATLNASADLQTTCSALEGAPVAFGAMSSAQALGKTANGSIAVKCDPGIAFAVGLDYGNHSTNTTTRNMVCAADGTLMVYELYADAAYSTPITPIVIGSSITGDSTASTPGDTGILSATDLTVVTLHIPVYGKILSTYPAPCPSGYTDSVAIVLGY
jgi:spore coat protein U-like protein